MNQHTPGPWRIGNAGHTVFGPKTDYPSPVTIADMPLSSRLTLGERQANARLIAAAPELLAALQRLLDWTDSGCDPSRKALTAARDAVNKALGVQS